MPTHAEMVEVFIRQVRRGIPTEELERLDKLYPPHKQPPGQRFVRVGGIRLESGDVPFIGLEPKPPTNAAEIVYLTKWYEEAVVEESKYKRKLALKGYTLLKNGTAVKIDEGD